jgi:hypothetical protein
MQWSLGADFRWDSASHVAFWTRSDWADRRVSRACKFAEERDSLTGAFLHAYYTLSLKTSERP